MLAQQFEERYASALNRFLKESFKGRVVAEGVFTNTTPLWVGDAFGDTVTQYGLAVPSPRAVVGRARWVIKALASVATNNYRLDKLENLASRLFGSAAEGARASRYRLIVVPEKLCGSDELYLRPDWISQFIRSLPQGVFTVGDVKCVQSMIESLRCYGYVMLLEEVGENNLANFVRSGCDKRFAYQVGKCNHVAKEAVTDFVQRILKEARNIDLVRRYLILTTVPRYYFTIHGLIPHMIRERCGPGTHGKYPSKCVLEAIEKALYRMQPVPPGCVRIRLRLVIREHRDRYLDRVAWSAIYLVLTLFGVGKVASRGFGRFSEEGAGEDVVLEHPGTIINYVSEEGVTHAIDEVVSVGKIRKVKHPCPIPPHLWPGVRVGTSSADLVDKYGRVIWSDIPCIRNKKAPVSPEGVLSAIGHSTLKAVWKIAKGKLMRSGKHYHTWALGLPRTSKIGKRRRGLPTPQDRK